MPGVKRYSFRPRRTSSVSEARKEFMKRIMEKESSSNDSDYEKRDEKRIKDDVELEEEENQDYFQVQDGEEDQGEEDQEEEEDELDEEGNIKNLVASEEDYEPKMEEEWVLDKALLGTIVEKRIVANFPELREENKKLYTTIIEALGEADEGLVEQYCGVKPNDQIWKVGLTPEKIAELEPKLQEARYMIDSETPSLVRILETDLTSVDRKKAVQLFDIYKNIEPYTTEELEMKEKINSFLKSASRNIIPRVIADIEESRIMQGTPSIASESMKSRIINLTASDVKKKRMLEVLQELEETPKGTTMYRTTKEKLEWMVSLPYDAIQPLEVDFNKSTPEEINSFCFKIRDKLDNDPEIGLYGMKEAKDEIIAALNNRITNPRSNVMVCLVGKPGTGKSAIAAAVATAVGLPFERISLGGVTDSSFILGSDPHYLGSAPGIVLKILRNMKVSNGVVLLDEIDKLGSDERGLAVQAAVMHITDYTSNKDFRDKYLADYGHDISNIWFMASCNDPERLLPPLKDRLSPIAVEKYNSTELKSIARNYVLPRVLKDVSIPKELVTMDDSGASAILSILESHIDLEGVRPLQKLVRMIVSRINLLRTTTLPDGTTGKLQISYKIPGFKLPIVINSDVVYHLIDRTKLTRVSSKLHMYI